ncbi:hypothetical protein ES705_17152 [subsurface metagenome]
MTYLKVILTILTAVLIFKCTMDYVPIAQAQTDSIQRVNVVQINGYRIYGDELPVIID